MFRFFMPASPRPLGLRSMEGLGRQSVPELTNFACYVSRMDEGPFYRWLVDTQLAPVFRAHAFVQRACVLLIPQPWMLPASLRKATPLLILFTAREVIDLEAAVDALVREAQDPNLPAGVSSYDLHPPVAWPEPDAERPAP